MKKTKKLWKQKFRNQPQPPPQPLPSPAPPPAVQTDSAGPPPPDASSLENLRQILETAMLKLLREIKSRDLQELQIHTLINLTNSVARAMTSLHRPPGQKSTHIASSPEVANNPTPKAVSKPGRCNDLRHYPEEWDCDHAIPGVDPDEGREEFILNDPGLREFHRNLSICYGHIPKDKVDAYLDSPAGKAARLASPDSRMAWDKRRGIKGPDYIREMIDEVFAKENKPAPIQT